MENLDIISLLPVLLIALALLILLVIILRRILVNVDAREIAIKERRYFRSSASLERFRSLRLGPTNWA